MYQAWLCTCFPHGNEGQFHGIVKVGQRRVVIGHYCSIIGVKDRTTGGLEFIPLRNPAGSLLPGDFNKLFT